MFAGTPHPVCGGSGSEDVPERAGASTLRLGRRQFHASRVLCAVSGTSARRRVSSVCQRARTNSAFAETELRWTQNDLRPLSNSNQATQRLWKLASVALRVLLDLYVLKERQIGVQLNGETLGLSRVGFSAA
jgi:hypothetical protein